MTPAKDPEALRRELVGWYLYDFANSAFFQSAMTVRARSTRLGPSAICRRRSRQSKCHFARFLVSRRVTLTPLPRRDGTRRCSCRCWWTTSRIRSRGRATARPGPNPAPRSRTTRSRPTACSAWKATASRSASVDPVSGAVTYADLPSLELPGGINPTSFIFTMISISVLFQAIVFITVGSLEDYGNYRRRGLVVSSTLGACACCAFIVLPFSASLYWLGVAHHAQQHLAWGFRGVLQLVPLPLMVEDSALVQGAVEGKRRARSATTTCTKREGGKQQYSSKGQMWGYVGARRA